MEEDQGGSSQIENNDKNENEDMVDVLPEDSVSNVASKHSSGQSFGSKKSSTCSTASAHIKAETERAVLVARAAALKEKHLLEVQEQQLGRRRQQLELEAEIAASTTKIVFFQASDSKSVSKRTIR